MKYLTIIFLTISFLNASMLMDSNTLCIEDYYTKDGKFHYQKSIDLAWYSVNLNDLGSTVLHNFTYDSVNNICYPDVINTLGLDSTQYNFLLGLCGLIFGAVFLFFTVEAFVKVGKK
jgi:hypothetical protein